MSEITLKLFHDNDLIGVITKPSQDGLWHLGDIQLTAAAEQFKPVFAFFSDEENQDKEPPFPDEMLLNWFIEDENGERREIGLPEVENEIDVYWRYI